jgi:hypothetical protein
MNDGRQQGDDLEALRFDGMPQCMDGILAAAPVKDSLSTFHTAKLVDRRRFRVSLRDKSECVIMIVTDKMMNFTVFWRFSTRRYVE